VNGIEVIQGVFVELEIRTKGGLGSGLILGKKTIGNVPGEVYSASIRPPPGKGRKGKVS